MNVPWWVVELAAAFWTRAGRHEPFPRDLRTAIACAFPLPVVTQRSLSTRAVREWLCRRRLACPLPNTDYPLRACLVARDGAGYIFVDDEDDPAEQRFSVAHELAHFLRHYWHPRQRAAARLGPAVLEVFDGRRAPQPVEHLHALLVGVRLGFHSHLMHRDARHMRPTSEVLVAEEEADRLAFELLAPAKEVAARLGTTAGEGTRARAATLLRDSFGLPPARAAGYAAILLPDATADPLLRWLGIKS